MPMILLVVTY